MTRRQSDPGKEMGVVAVVAMAVCCGLPLLLGATSLAVTGVVFGSSVVVIGAVTLAVFAFGRARTRARNGDDCCDPTQQQWSADRRASESRPHP
jgi:Flp pilus assembly protein TadB